MNFDVENPSRWTMQKLGKEISPLNIVKGGNRKAHCVEKLIYSGADGKIVITPKYSPLVCMGGKNLYYFDDKLPDLYEGFAFILYDNKWDTNFKMWFEEDFQTVYEIEIQ